MELAQNLGICSNFSQTRRRARPSVGRGGADRADCVRDLELRELEVSNAIRVAIGLYRSLSGRDGLWTPTASADEATARWMVVKFLPTAMTALPRRHMAEPGLKRS